MGNSRARIFHFHSYDRKDFARKEGGRNSSSPQQGVIERLGILSSPLGEVLRKFRGLIERQRPGADAKPMFLVHPRRTGRSHGIGGVQEKVDHDLLELMGIPFPFGQVGLKFFDHLHLFPHLLLVREERKGILDHRVYIYFLLDPALPGDAGAVAS